MNSFFRDLVFGVRLLLKSPGFTIVAVLSLAVGIGVNSTVFGFVNAVLFRSISVPNPDGLVYVMEGDRAKLFKPTSWSNYQDFLKQNDVFSGLAVFAAPPMLMTRGEQTEEISAEVVSANYFSVFDVRLKVGQSFSSSDDELAVSPPSVVISDRLWKRRLDSDSTVVGKQLLLNGTSFTVVGIAPETFTGMDPSVSVDVWVPVTQWAAIVEKKSDKIVEETKTEAKPKESGRLGRDHNWLQMIGRLKPGMSVEQAEAAMTTIAQRLEVNSKLQDIRITLSPISAVHPQIAQEMPTGIIIIVVTGVVLMICCVNVASLMLARAAVRRKEFAVRLALGSTRTRLVRQLMTEALLLSLMGGILGLIFAYWTTRAVLGLLPPADLIFTAAVAIDRRVLLFSFSISVLTALVFGLLPALNTVRSDLLHSLGAESMSLGVGKRKINLRRALVVVQIIASFVLLIGSGIFVRSFQSGQSLNSSFKSDRILVLNLSPKKYGFATNYKKAFYRDLVNRIGAMPGVESVTVSNIVPLTIEQDNVSVQVNGREPIRLRRSIVGAGYFETLNIPIVLGRTFSDDDSSRRVAIVNEAMVRACWPGENPLGKTLNSGQNLTYEIVGVAKDSAYNNLGRASEPYLYLSLYQRETDADSLIVRTSVDPKSMIAGMQREIKELGGDLPIFDFKTLDEVAKSQILAVKAGAALLGLLSLIGVLVAAIGIYGVTSFAFNQRRREIGIRMSLGAQRTDILGLIMKEGISLALSGIIIGALLAAGAMYFISSLLFGVSTIDPVVFVLVAALLSLVAIGASLVPGIMAAKSDPVEALRHE